MVPGNGERMTPEGERVPLEGEKSIPLVYSILQLGKVLAAAVAVDKEHTAEGRGGSVMWDDKMGEPLSLQHCPRSSLPYLYQN